MLGHAQSCLAMLSHTLSCCGFRRIWCSYVRSSTWYGKWRDHNATCSTRGDIERWWPCLPKLRFKTKIVFRTYQVRNLTGPQSDVWYWFLLIFYAVMACWLNQLLLDLPAAHNLRRCWLFVWRSFCAYLTRKVTEAHREGRCCGSQRCCTCCELYLDRDKTYILQ